jgi:hypothetical protein
MIESSLRVLVCAALAACAYGQTTLHIKTGTTTDLQETNSNRPIRRMVPAQKSFMGQQHLVVHFDTTPAQSAVEELGRRRGRFVQYVPDSGYMFAFSAGQDWSSTSLSVRRMRAEDKVSPALGSKNAAGVRAGTATLLVEFHPDVDQSSAMAVARSQGYEVLSHPDLLEKHLLLRGPLDQVEELAAWDEVSYVFPASQDLIGGERVYACMGASTELGNVGQYVSVIGEGWDGAGRGSANLGYFWKTLTSRLSEGEVKAEIGRAMAEWSRVAAVQFGQAFSATAARTVNILFATGDHGDGYPFDGQGGSLAHTFYPSPPNPEPIAGDMHFDGAEEWVTGPDVSTRSVDLFSVALHELGHALGLGHSDLPRSVMYPYYRRASSLTAEDINAILTLYAAPTVTGDDPGTTPGGGEGPGSGDAPATPVPLVLTIGSPSVFPLAVASSPVGISGTATGGTSPVTVSYSTSAGFKGPASGSAAWTTSVPLVAGSNAITITALDSNNVTASRSVSVTLMPVADTVAPALTITSPSTSTYTTTATSIKVAGTASDNVGVTSVTWQTATNSGVAAGTTNWAASVPLLAGTNTIKVRAYDAAGNNNWKSIVVTRK